MAPKDLKYRRGEYLAVLGDDGSEFWVCRAAQHVYQSTDEFNVNWMEKTGYNFIKFFHICNFFLDLPQWEVIFLITIYDQYF